MTPRTRKKDLVTFILYFFGFMLLWEWLRPVEQLTDTANIWVFIIFIVVSLLLGFFKIPRIFSVVLKAGYIVCVLQFLHGDGTFLQLQWIAYFLTDLRYNAGMMLNQDWLQLTDMFRSLLFFILMWLMAYLIQYWLINRKQIFLFFFMTLIYITVLDTFTPYAANGAIIRTIVMGFAVMGMLTYFRHLEGEDVKRNLRLPWKWMAPLTVMICLSVAIGWIGPKMEPIWPDPVPYIKSYAEDAGTSGSSVRKIGYGEDDSQLGGPFLPDNTVVMRTGVEERHYWKIETKDVYTGKGWIASGGTEDRQSFGNQEEVPVASYEPDTASEIIERTSSAVNVMNYQHIAYPLGIKSIDAPARYMYEVSPNMEKIHSTENGSPAAVPAYTVTYDAKRFSISAMRAAVDGMQVDAAFLEQYTQLPESLPDRVRELAAEITADSSNWLDKSRALERYFNSSGFTYDQRDVAVPEADEDYVDQFLFETLKGYCDNFSTSMVVMARSLGIPARWVKGFTEGDYIERMDNNILSFEITNNNAHSWVEIYFPNVGWVPFEPTQGFSNNVSYNFDVESEQRPLEPQAPNQPQTPEQGNSNKADQTGFSMEKVWKFFLNFLKENKLFLAAVGVAALLLSLFAYKVRGRWLPHYYIWKWKNANDDEDFAKAYLILLKELKRYGLQREDGQTLRAYAKTVDHHYATDEMTRLTVEYEKLVYRGAINNGRWLEMKELWENLIKKTIA